MESIRDEIASALLPLVGLPLWGAGRVVDMEMFDFGGRHKQRNRKGEEVEVGDYALHIQCPWRIVGAAGIVVGSQDRAYPGDEASDWEQFDDEKDPARLEARLNLWLEQYRDSPLEVQRVEVDAVGGFRLFLASDFILETFPANSLCGEYSEHWRLFSPCDDTSHFVVTGHGIL